MGKLFSGGPLAARRTLLIVIGSIFFSLVQIRLTAQTERSARQSLFLEGGGAAPYYSFNYSLRIFKGEGASGYIRLGSGIWGKYLSLPVGLTTVFGKGKHHPELTLCISPLFEGLRFWDRDASDLFLDLVLGLGYRFEPPQAPFFLSAGAFPFLRLDPTTETLSEKAVELRFRPGLSAGWKF